MPEATPLRSGGTSRSPTPNIGAKVKPVPAPARASGPTSCHTEASAVACQATSPRPAEKHTMPQIRSRLGPADSMRRPLTPAARTDTSGMTAMTRPASDADSPCTDCRYSVSGRKAPTTPKPTVTAIRFMTVKLWIRKSAKGTSGTPDCRRRWSARKTARTTSPAARIAHTVPDHSSRSPSTSANTTAPIPTSIRATEPTPRGWRRAGRGSGRYRVTSAKVSRPMGRLT